MYVCMYFDNISKGYKSITCARVTINALELHIIFEANICTP